MIEWVEARTPISTWLEATTRPLPAAGVVRPMSDLTWFAADGGRHGMIAGSTGGWAFTDDEGRAAAESLFDRDGDPADDPMAEALWRRGLVEIGGVGVFDGLDMVAAIENTRQRYTVVLLLNTGCNLACDYCYLGHRMPTEEFSMPKATALAAIDEALATQWDEVMFDFGEIAASWHAFEPLVEETLRRADEAGKRARIAIQTNATTIDEAKADKLARWDAVVGISLDGPQEIHDSARTFRSGAGSYAKVVATLDLLRERGVAVHLISTIGRHNVARPGDVLDELARHGAASFLLKPVLAEGEAAEAWDQHGADPVEFAGFATRALRHAAARDDAPLDQSATKFLARLLGDTNGWRDSCTSRYCGSGRTLHVIDPAGNSHACPRFVDDDSERSAAPARTVQLGIPSLRGQAPSRPSLRNLLPDELRQPPSDCDGCAWLSSCGGGCTLIARDDGRADVPMPDPHCVSYDETHRELFTVFIPAFLDGRFREATPFNGARAVSLVAERE